MKLSIYDRIHFKPTNDCTYVIIAVMSRKLTYIDMLIIARHILHRHINASVADKKIKNHTPCSLDESLE